MDFVYSHFTANGIKLEEYPFQSEAVMEAYLIENKDVLILNEGEDVKEVLQQYSVFKSSGKSGRLDILADFGSSIAVVELKKGILDEEAFTQLNNYFGEDGYPLFKDEPKLKIPLKDRESVSWLGILVGSGIDPALLSKIQDGDKKLKGNLTLGIIILKRYQGDRQVYVLSDIYVSNKGKDYTRYMVDNEGNYPKCRVALAMIKRYLEKNQKATAAEIESFFNKYIEFQNGIPLLRPLSFFNDNANEKRKQYYALEEKYQVKIESTVYVVTDWWWTINETEKLEKNVAIDMKLDVSKIQK